ncbi:ABC transporter ATP-binding protein [Yinghuangia soli]|uniref:ABC transporter ATP-binding protein/permease n=1 Tax=Yinghuangia soli TaxID=2908204 RepID=A0AA41Q5P4_9ACTN|nr:ABC transporter ATP-binding protein [Yinghuangia soli]MCF2531111.1 ABC transporter ATP-binding protein/permease [Yinghuangia soli]
MLIRLVRDHLRPYSRAVALLMVLQLVQTAATLYLPNLNARILDHGVAHNDQRYIVYAGAVMAAIALTQLVCAYGAARIGARVGMAFGRDVRRAVFAHVQTFSARELGRFGAPSLITRTTNDVQQVQMLVLLTLTLMVSAPIMCLGGVALAIDQDPGLSLALVVLIPVLGVAIGAILRRLAPLSTALQTSVDTVNRILREQITGLRVIRAFVKEEHESRRFGAANSDLTDVSLRVGHVMAWMFPAVMTIANVAGVAVLWFGAQRVADGEMTIGGLTAFISYVLMMLMAAVMATFMLLWIPRAEVSARRIVEVLETQSSVAPPLRPVHTLIRRGHVELCDITFRFPGAEKSVLEAVSLSVGPGETTAIIGGTGSGKSTLLALIPRLSDATDGRVLVGGVDVRELDPAVLAGTVGYVPQRPFLFSGTVASNLRYGAPGATDEDLWRALEIAQARDFVAALPDGLDARIAQGGGNVSGGQRQRLAIARALVGRPQVYLFDDSFSALDYATDARLRAALARETSEAAVIVVAQRVNSIRDADRIVVLDAGRIVGEGTHPELLAGNPTYREIVLSQLTEEEAA